VGHEVVASQAIPFPMKSVRLQPGVFSQAAEGKQPLHRFNCGLGGKKNSPEPADLVPEGTRNHADRLSREAGGSEFEIAHSVLGEKREREGEWTAPAGFRCPGSYLVLRGPWKNGDRIELSLPMQLHAAPMPDRESLQAAMYGPLVVAARFDDEPKEKWYRHYQAQTKQEPAPPLQFKGKLDDPASWLQPGEGKLTFRGSSQGQTVAFVPLSSILHERYFVYHELQA
jgi:hypothetical protein